MASVERQFRLHENNPYNIIFINWSKVQLYDTLTGKTKRFVTKDNHVRMLLCGPTVYDYAHIGHARMLLFYDLMARYLRSKKMVVSVVLNITDIDQKIFSKAKSVGADPSELAGRFVDALIHDLSALGIEGFALARVRGQVSTARQLIAELLQAGKAYSAGGNVYLLTATVRSFGKMARMTRKDLDDCRLDISPAKKSPSDILLWNSSENFDISFQDRVLGTGIPWWHVQDSAVAVANFDGSYDIHGGANELVYPHHESHLAQLVSWSSNDKPVSFWTHVGLVRVENKKISNSLGNTIAIHDLLRTHSPNALRLYFYSRYYRDDFEFAQNTLCKFQLIDDMISAAMNDNPRPVKMAARFFDCLEHDFDTPGALKVLVESAKSRSADLKAMVSIFGLHY